MRALFTQATFKDPRLGLCRRCLH